MRRAEKALEVRHFSRDFSRNFSGWIFIGAEKIKATGEDSVG